MKIATLTQTSSLSLPTNSYVYEIVPVEAHIAAISSDDSLRLVDRTTLRELSTPLFSQVHKGVTCLESLETNKYSLCTAGRDALVRLWDLRSGRISSEFSDGKRVDVSVLVMC